ncbi:hypothetical protein [Gorillibacterium sp. sgz500922]|uniref:hypothetical protein n=1 Tax=Gorillibacterium sp. sgz500922 TaxID=3446694 RepID=UPI003F681E0B
MNPDLKPYELDYRDPRRNRIAAVLKGASGLAFAAGWLHPLFLKGESLYGFYWGVWMGFAALALVLLGMAEIIRLLNDIRNGRRPEI